MNRVLAIGFLTLLSFHTGRALTCLACKNVMGDNTCFHNERNCVSGGFDFCYSRLITKEMKVVSVDRGCTPVCRLMKKSKENFEEKMLCCVQDYCNTHNFWLDK